MREILIVEVNLSLYDFYSLMSGNRVVFFGEEYEVDRGYSHSWSEFELCKIFFKKVKK